MSPRDLRATLSALVLLPALWIALRILGLRRLAGWIERRPLAQSEIDRPTAIDEAVRAVARASRRGAGRGTCLSQSLALVHLLRRRGIQSALRLGVRKSGERMEAHAWVEADGVVLNDSADVAARFVPLPSLDEVR